LVVIDTLNRSISAGGRDENSNSDMSRVISLFEMLCKGTGCSAIFAHHVSKGAAAGGRRDQQAARGAGAVADSARWQANLSVKASKKVDKKVSAQAQTEKEEAEEIILEVTKANYGPKPKPRTLTRHDARPSIRWLGRSIASTMR